MPRQHYEPPGTLYKKTIDLFNADTRPVEQIARESKLPFYWLRKLRSGNVSDPGVNRVQKLYEFLSEETLALK